MKNKVINVEDKVYIYSSFLRLMVFLRRRGQMWESLIPWIIAVIVLILSLSLYFIISGKGANAINFISDLFRFGGSG